MKLSYFETQVSLASLAVASMKVGIAMSIDANGELGASCVMGLLYRSDASQPTFFDLVKGKLSSHLFTVDRRDKGTGMFNFGWIDEGAHSGDVAYAAVPPNQ